MRVLLDEHLNWRFARAFTGHDVRSVRGMGRAGRQNGDLLSAAAQAFDVLVAMDRNMEHQQSLPMDDLAVVLLVGPSNRLEDTRRAVPAMERLLEAGVVAGRLCSVAVPR